MKQQPQQTRATGTVTQPVLLTAKQVCERFGVSRTWIQRHAHELPHFRLGTLLKFSEKELLAWFRRAACEER